MYKVFMKYIFSCCLMLDAMSIRKQLLYDGHSKTTVGFINLGVGEEEESEQLASEALVFMLVGLRGKWKAPIAYYFTRSLTIETQTELMLHCLEKLTDLGFKIHALTMDGHATNIGMCTKLGACMKIDRLAPWFTSHEADQQTNILLDPCHMIKLLRNTFQHFGVIISPNGVIMWNYIKDLQSLQEDLGLKLANKLTADHVNFESQKMKVMFLVKDFIFYFCFSIYELFNCTKKGVDEIVLFF